MSVIHIDFRKGRSRLANCLNDDTVHDFVKIVEVLEAAESAAWLSPSKHEVDQLTLLSEFCERYLEAYDRVESQLVEVIDVEVVE